MTDSTERRSTPRDQLERLLVAILLDPVTVAGTAGDSHTFASILNHSPGGAMLEACVAPEAGASLAMLYHDEANASWVRREARVIWCKPHAVRGFHLVGLEYLPQPATAVETSPEGVCGDRACHEELDFLLHSELLDTVPQHALVALLNRLERVSVAPGTRVMVQGEPGEALYLIYQGELEVLVDTGGGLYRVALRRSSSVTEKERFPT